jgi:hypothetical protein
MIQSELKLDLGAISHVCASCSKIRDVNGSWNPEPDPVPDNSEKLVSHGLCPDCMTRIYPWFNQAGSTTVE